MEEHECDENSLLDSSSYFKKFREKLKTFHEIVDFTKFSRKNGAKRTLIALWKNKKFSLAEKKNSLNQLLVISTLLERFKFFPSNQRLFANFGQFFAL